MNERSYASGRGRGEVVKANRPASTVIGDAEQRKRGCERIATATLPLFLLRGYHGTSVRDIARASHMSVGAIFNYFPSKEDLLFHFLQVLQERVEEALTRGRRDFERYVREGRDPEDAFVELYERYALAVHGLRDYLLLGYQETKALTREHRHSVLERERAMQAFLAEVIQYGVKKGAFQCDDVPGCAHSLQVLAQAWSIRRWALTSFASFEDYLAFLRKAALRLVGAAGAPRSARGHREARPGRDRAGTKERRRSDPSRAPGRRDDSTGRPVEDRLAASGSDPERSSAERPAGAGAVAIRAVRGAAFRPAREGGSP